MPTDLSDKVNAAAKTVQPTPPTQIQFRTSGQAGYEPVKPVSYPKATEATRSDNCRFKPSGC